MKKIFKIINASVIMIILFIFSVSIRIFGAPQDKQQYYEIRIYRITPDQEARVDNFLKNAYLPALHRAGIPRVGVFKPVEKDTAYGKLVYLFIPFESMDQYLALTGKLEKDKVYNETGKDFLDAPYNDPPYKRHESILLKAFAFMPQFKAPDYTNPHSERIYELRSYESATETKAIKKIHMFNEGGEIKLFESLNFNAVFYGEVLMGSHKPNLMYMITFKDMATHDERWQAFRTSPGWKQLSGLEEYSNTVSKANPYLLHPASYSDF